MGKFFKLVLSGMEKTMNYVFNATAHMYWNPRTERYETVEMAMKQARIERSVSFWAGLKAIASWFKAGSSKTDHLDGIAKAS